MPSPAPALSRRHVLVGAAALAMLGATTACGTQTPQPDVDALRAQADRARSDAQLAAAAATTAPPPLAKSLTTISAERTAHGQALEDELARMAPSPSSTSGSPTTTVAPATPPAPTANSVAAALKASADAAATVAAQQSGYRAGLLGSIAAACAAAHDVTLGGLPAS